jgi:hypothetical protein
MLSERNAKKLFQWTTYPRGANCGTEHTLYRCACGWGFIEYAWVPGFDDDYALIRCFRCRKKYSVDYGCGARWSLSVREKKS